MPQQIISRPEPLPAKTLPEAFADFIQTLKSQKELSAVALLEASNARFEAEHVVLTLGSTQLVSFEKHKENFLETLRRLTGIRNLQVVISEPESHEMANVMLSPTDRWKKIREEYPMLEEFRKRLDLDLEY